MVGGSAPSGRERRRHTRFDLTGVRGRLRADGPGTRPVDVCIHNVSSGGLLVELSKHEEAFAVGKALKISVLLNAAPPTEELPCGVARALAIPNRHLLGLQFRELQ